jgi:hypothetical protein
MNEIKKIRRHGIEYYIEDEVARNAIARLEGIVPKIEQINLAIEQVRKQYQQAISALNLNDLKGVPDWIKSKTKPVYTAEEVGALPNTVDIPEPQVQSDWEQTDTDAVDFIRNKPVIPSQITVDSQLSLSSRNPVENKAVAFRFESMQQSIASKADTSALSDVAMSGSYSDLTDTPTIPEIPANISSFNNDVGYLTSFTETDPTVPAYIKAITQQDIVNWNSKTSNIGTITGITMNGVSKGTSGIVDLGTVLTSHQSLAGYATTQYVDNAFSNLVGSAPAVLDTIEELAAALGEDKNFATTVTNQLSNKVDKVSGKGLSTNDYTTADRDKLAGIAAGAEVNVNADWNATGGDAQILNKPTLFSGDYNDLTNKPSIPSAYDDTALSNRIGAVETGLQDKADASDVYTKSEVDTKTAKTTARGDNKLLYNG